MKCLRWPAVIAALFPAMIAGGCGVEDTGRTLNFKPGVYQGEKVPPLTEEQQRQLTERSKLMRF